MFIRRLTTIAALFLSTAEAQELEGVYAPTQGPCPTVEEALGKMVVPDGYQVRNFAAEPLVINPVAMTWDHRGRLWVVELYEYPTGAKQPNEYSKTAADERFRPVPRGEGPQWPRDRVVIVEDTDNDGKADKRTVFVDGLNLATGILCGFDGVFVGQAPNLFFFRDTNGDDRADDYKTVLTGFGLEDRHELLNSFTWGPDGWLHFTHGVFTHSKIRRPGEPQDQGNVLNAGIYRVRFESGCADSGPTAAFHEVFSDGTSNPWGCDYDAAGNWFVEACVIDHLFHMAPGCHYQRQGGAPENPYAYGLLPSIVNHKHFRAAYAGIQVYQGGIYPMDTAGHLFFGNIHDNSVHEEMVAPSGATFKASPVRDFLRANNGWFRPVSIQTGPDGFLWIMDWCDKYPCYQNAQANPEGVDRERGRIWRICYVGSEEGKKLAGMSRTETGLNLQKWSDEQLIQSLLQRNSWTSRTAAVVLQTRKSEAVTNGLRGILSGRKPLAAQLQALGLLQAHGLPGDSLPEIFTANEADELALTVAASAEAIRCSAHPETSPLWKTFERLCGSSEDPAAQAAIATAIRRIGAQHLTTGGIRDIGKPQPGLLQCIGELFNTFKKTSDRTLIHRAWLAFEPLLAAQPEHGLRALEFVLQYPDTAAAAVLANNSARRLVDTRSSGNVDLLLANMKSWQDKPAIVAAALEGMLKAQEAGAVKPSKVDPTPIFEQWGRSTSADVRNLAGRLATLWGDPNAVAALMGLVLDPSADPNKRIEAIRTVRKLRSDQARAGIAKLLTEKNGDALTIEALLAAAELGGRDLSEAVLKGWEQYSPSVRTSAAEVMISRPDWASKLLDGVEGKWIPAQKLNAADLPATVRRFFAVQADAAMKERAAKLLGAWNETNADTKALIAAKKTACLTGEPNMETGKLIFTTTCAVCHKFHGGGQEVGPELIGSGRSNLDALLANVIDPNQVIGNGYENVVVSTKDGRTLAGRVVEDTPTQVTLLGIGGRREVVGRADIAKLENTHQSLMPMGFGALPDEQFRDLIWYVLAPPEEGALTKEKREAMIRSVDDVADPAKPSAGERIDWESVSLWNPDWKVTAPEFEGTPRKLPEHLGQKNVLELHPFEQNSHKPARLEHTVAVSSQKPGKLRFLVASHDKGDWELRVFINGSEVKRQIVNAEGSRWQKIEIDLTPWKGQQAAISLENWANNWMYEFSYWGPIQIE